MRGVERRAWAGLVRVRWATWMALSMCLGLAGCGRAGSAREGGSAELDGALVPAIVLLQIEGLDAAQVERLRGARAELRWGLQVDGSLGFERAECGSEAGTLATLLCGAGPQTHGLIAAADVGAHRASPGARSLPAELAEQGWRCSGHAALDWLGRELCGPRRGFQTWSAGAGAGEPPARTTEALLERAAGDSGGAARTAPLLLVGVYAVQEFEGAALGAEIAAELPTRLQAFGADAGLAEAARAGDAAAWEQLVARHARRRGSPGNDLLRAAYAQRASDDLERALAELFAGLARTHRVRALGLVVPVGVGLERPAWIGWAGGAGSPPGAAWPAGLLLELAAAGGVELAPAEAPAAAVALDELRGFELRLPEVERPLRLELRTDPAQLVAGRVQSAGAERALDVRRGRELTWVQPAAGGPARLRLTTVGRATELRIELAWADGGAAGAETPIPAPVERLPDGALRAILPADPARPGTWLLHGAAADSAGDAPADEASESASAGPVVRRLGPGLRGEPPLAPQAAARLRALGPGH